MLKRFAQVFLVDQAVGEAYLRGGFDDQDRENVTRLAERIRLGNLDAERTIARYRKRHGLA